MIRTQISLTEAQKAWLDSRSSETGLSISELIRRALEECYSSRRPLEHDLRAITESAGAWSERDFNGEEYVERLRTARRLDH
ncbi:MAG: ribbon-helix-helix protein, CopG family [Dehalococcoidia bacterium]|nr:ribbon-helix-helix protein, CopG family [Dehalococcoidia bacterium]